MPVLTRTCFFMVEDLSAAVRLAGAARAYTAVEFAALLAALLTSALICAPFCLLLLSLTI